MRDVYNDCVFPILERFQSFDHLPCRVCIRVPGREGLRSLLVWDWRLPEGVGRTPGREGLGKVKGQCGPFGRTNSRGSCRSD